MHVEKVNGPVTGHEGGVNVCECVFRFDAAEEAMGDGSCGELWVYRVKIQGVRDVMFVMFSNSVMRDCCVREYKHPHTCFQN